MAEFYFDLLTKNKGSYKIRQEHTFDGGSYEKRKKFQSDTTGKKDNGTR